MTAESSADDLALKHVWTRLPKLHHTDDQGTLLKLNDNNARQVSFHFKDKECTEVRFITISDQNDSKTLQVASETATGRLLKKGPNAKDLYVKKFHIPPKHSIVSVKIHRNADYLAKESVPICSLVVMQTSTLK